MDEICENVFYYTLKSFLAPRLALKDSFNVSTTEYKAEVRDPRAGVTRIELEWLRWNSRIKWLDKWLCWQWGSWWVHNCWRGYFAWKYKPRTGNEIIFELRCSRQWNSKILNQNFHFTFLFAISFVDTVYQTDRLNINKIDKIKVNTVSMW